MYSRITRNSFGITQPKYFTDGVRKHLIVLNADFILHLNITDNELDAIIAHELGHIFNIPNGNIENYSQQIEFYADYFAKSMGLIVPLISGINKLIEQPNAPNIELFWLRIDKLNTDEVFDGAIKQL